MSTLSSISSSYFPPYYVKNEEKRAATAPNVTSFTLTDLQSEAMLKAGKGQKEEALSLIRDGYFPASLKWLSSKPDNIDHFFDKLFLDYVRKEPELLTDLGLLDSINISTHNNFLDDYSIEAKEEELAKAKENLKTLESYPFESLTDEQKISYKIFHQWLSYTVASEPFLLHEYPITQLSGIISKLSETFTLFHKLEKEEDFKTYLERLTKIPTALLQLQNIMLKQQQAGITPPKFALEKVLSNLNMVVLREVIDHPFYQYFMDHFQKLKGGDLALREGSHQIIGTIVIPAYDAFFKFLIDFSHSVHTNHSVDSLPNGAAYYAYCLKKETTTDLTPDEIYQLGLRQVAFIQSEMRSLLKAVGFEDDKASLGELMGKLKEDPKHFFPNTEEGKLACLEEFNKILDRSRKELSPYFDLKPKTPVKIVCTPKHEEDGAPGGYYYSPSLDGSREGTFYVNLKDTKMLPKFGIPTLLVHEAEPGHHFQLTLQAESSLPLLRKLVQFNAYNEGWALYTEKLAYEKGFYTSAYDKLGHLQDELLRAVRLVVDPAIHSKGWSREEAIEYMQKQTGYDIDSVVSEIERYFVWPGQACSYKVGQLKILELRKKAMEINQDKFDIKKFHNAVLQIGSCPLTVLEEVIMAKNTSD